MKDPSAAIRKSKQFDYSTGKSKDIKNRTQKLKIVSDQLHNQRQSNQEPAFRQQDDQNIFNNDMNQLYDEMESQVNTESAYK